MITFNAQLPSVAVRGPEQLLTTCSWWDFDRPRDNTEWPNVGDKVEVVDPEQQIAYVAKVLTRKSCPWQPGDMCWFLEVDTSTLQDRIPTDG